MFYQIKKDEFLILCQEQTGGVVITLSLSDTHPTQTFCVTHPGNLFMLDIIKNSWTLINSKSLVANVNDHMIRAVKALIIAISRIPINNTYLKFDNIESQFIEAICYDIATSRPLSWFPSAVMYYLGNGKLVTTVSQKVVGEYLLDNNNIRSLKPINKSINQSETPKLVVTPASTPSSFVATTPTNKIINPSVEPVEVQTVVVHKKVKKANTKKANTKNPNSKQTKTMSEQCKADFYRIVKDRSQYKKSPEWIEECKRADQDYELYKTRLEEEKEKLRIQSEQRKKEDDKEVERLKDEWNQKWNNSPISVSSSVSSSIPLTLE